MNLLGLGVHGGWRAFGQANDLRNHFLRNWLLFVSTNATAFVYQFIKIHYVSFHYIALMAEYIAPPTLSLVARCREVWHSATHHRLMEASNGRAFPYLTGVLGCLGDNDP